MAKSGVNAVDQTHSCTGARRRGDREKVFVRLVPLKSMDTDHGTVRSLPPVPTSRLQPSIPVVSVTVANTREDETTYSGPRFCLVLLSNKEKSFTIFTTCNSGMKTYCMYCQACAKAQPNTALRSFYLAHQAHAKYYQAHCTRI